MPVDVPHGAVGGLHFVIVGFPDHTHLLLVFGLDNVLGHCRTIF